jgi:hypothetical protein
MSDESARYSPEAIEYTQAEADEAWRWLRDLSATDYHAAVMCAEIVRLWRQIEIRNAIESRPGNGSVH